MAEINEAVPSSSTATSATTTPRVIRFGYCNFNIKGDKWFAKCTSCNKELTDKVGVTTGFVK